MGINENTIERDMDGYYKIMQENTYGEDINKVFIPFRPILEFELVISSLLAKENYEKLAKLPYSSLDLSYIINELGISQESVFTNIIERFFKNIQNIIPIANYTRDHKKHYRYGNVNAYITSRIPVYYAIDRLKFKLVLLRNFLTYFREHHYILSEFTCYKQKSNKSFESILLAEYFSRMQDYFDTITWEPEYRTKFFKNPSKINFKMLCELNKFQLPHDGMNVVYIMRSIRASYLVAKITFKMMDVEEPFLSGHGNIESLILNREIIPGMLTAIDNAYRNRDMNKVREIVEMFEKYLTWMIKGLDYGYTIASNKSIEVDPEKTLYFSGDLTYF